MNIGIYKPYKKVFFHDQKDDLSSVSYEVVNTAQIFQERGHQVIMLSETDLQMNDEIRQGTVETKKSFDRILLFSGTFAKDKYHEMVIPTLRKLTPRLDFVLTDLRLTPSKNGWKYFDHVYHQATHPLSIIPVDPVEIPQNYGGISELYLYHLQQRPQVKKDLDFCFCGTERGRLNDILEYVRRPECRWVGKSKTFNFDNRVDRNTFKQILDRTKFSITIADENYNENHFVTPRTYEHSAHSIINFIDDKFDQDGYLESLDSYFRVSSYLELFEKMNEVRDTPRLYLQRLEEQRKCLENPEFLSGNFVYECLEGDEVK